MSTAFPTMANMTVREVRDYLARKSAVIVPMGAIEQHGYHLPLETDAVIARELARRVGESTETLVAPVIYHTFSGGALPGTINTSPAVMTLVVQDVLASLAAQGFDRFYLLLAHGGSENLRALEDGLKLLLRQNRLFADALVALLPVWQFDEAGTGWRQAIEEHDWHAGWLETSLMLALAPQWVRMDEITLDMPAVHERLVAHPDNYQRAEKPVDDPCVVPRMTQRPEIDVGVMGFPERASRERGETIAADMTRALAAKIRAIEAHAGGPYKDVAWTPPPLVL